MSCSASAKDACTPARENAGGQWGLDPHWPKSIPIEEGNVPETEEVDLSEFGPQRKPCKIASLGLDGEQLLKFQAACRREDIATHRITGVLAKWGFSVTANTVAKHRNGSCGCAR